MYGKRSACLVCRIPERDRPRMAMVVLQSDHYWSSLCLTFPPRNITKPKSWE